MEAGRGRRLCEDDFSKTRLPPATTTQFQILYQNFSIGLDCSMDDSKKYLRNLDTSPSRLELGIERTILRLAHVTSLQKQERLHVRSRNSFNLAQITNDTTLWQTVVASHPRKQICSPPSKKTIGTTKNSRSTFFTTGRLQARILTPCSLFPCTHKDQDTNQEEHEGQK